MKKSLYLLILIILSFNSLSGTETKLYPAKFPNGNYGYINSNYEVVIKGVYEEANAFVDGYAFVGKNNKYGRIDSTGKVVADFIYDDYTWLYECPGFKFFAVSHGYRWGIMNYNGSVFKEPFYYKDEEDQKESIINGLEAESSIHLNNTKEALDPVY